MSLSWRNGNREGQKVMRRSVGVMTRYAGYGSHMQAHFSTVILSFRPTRFLLPLCWKSTQMWLLLQSYGPFPASVGFKCVRICNLKVCMAMTFLVYIWELNICMVMCDKLNVCMAMTFLVYIWELNICR